MGFLRLIIDATMGFLRLIIDATMRFISKLTQQGLELQRISRKRLMTISLIAIIFIASFYFIFVQVFNNESGNDAENESKKHPDSPYEDIANTANTLSDRIAKLEIPETSVMDRHRVVFRDLAIILKKSDVISANGRPISDRLFSLANEIREAGDELGDFRHHASNFFYALHTEMSAIQEKLEEINRVENSFFSSIEIKFRITENFGMLGGQFRSSADDEGFIQDRLKTLEDMIPDFQAQLKKVMDSLDKIQESATNTHEYLIDGEREAEQVLKRAWFGAIRDYEDRVRAENELGQVRLAIKMLRKMASNLVNFESFLKQYRRQVQDVKSQIHVNRAMLKPTKQDIKYLKNSVKKLEENHRQFDLAQNRLDEKVSTLDEKDLWDVDDYSSRNRDCTEFQIFFEKPQAYLRSIRTWSSHGINALGFIFSDDSAEIFGMPGDATPHDFPWQKGERLRELIFSFGSIVYGIEFVTNSGRVSGWYGNPELGNKYVIRGEGKEWNGVHGSFSKYLCSIGVKNQ
ncbi:9483_t:CDS:2 [Ambispora gerdemannii]|uniref:9483_t:CDS:1 n=1 Tax=Ambispora gerdemannii TaxID=144530 RepID=A0A9N8Z5R8_9GLOM|nr:9483_t:CDS:2 [Ambispora gerdemannii]